MAPTSTGTPGSAGISRSSAGARPGNPLADRGMVIGFKLVVWSAHELPARDADQVHPQGRAGPTKQFASAALGAVARDRRPELLRRRHAEPGRGQRIRSDEDGHEGAVLPGAGLVGLDEIAAFPDAVAGTERLAHRRQRWRGASPDATTPTTPTAACGPWRGGASGR